MAAIDIFVGPVLRYLTIPDEANNSCVMQVSIPAQAAVPLHSHADRETFYMLSGKLEAFARDRWVTLRPGDTLDIVGGVEHALHNRSAASVSFLLVTTARLSRFFREIGRPATGQPLPPPAPADLQHFAEISQAYGYWLGGDDDNAAVALGSQSELTQGSLLLIAGSLETLGCDRCKIRR